MGEVNVPFVYEAILAVAGELAQTGIAKTNENKQQSYKFRGIDDVYNVLAPMLVRHGLIILPRAISRVQSQYSGKTGGVINSVTVEMEFDFIAVKDGSRHVIKTFGEAMDTADKATNKAMSAAYKYAAFQAFCIPTEGDNDADATTHEVAAPKRQPPAAPVAEKTQAASGASPATTAQLNAIKDAWKDAPEKLYGFLSETLGRTITSGKNLTIDDANKVLAALVK